MSKVDECGQCRFWKLRSDHAGASGGGYCRRFPPFFPGGLVLSHPMRRHDLADIELSDGFLNDAWPNVHQQSWCGEFRRNLNDEAGR